MNEDREPLPPLRTIIRRYDLRARRSMGQNYILDLNLLKRIARSAGNLGSTEVIEIGPGPGGLTRALLAEGAKRVIAIEKDTRFKPALEELRAHYPGKLELIFGDALRTRPVVTPGTQYRIVSNLPYNIASKLLVNWLTERDWPPRWKSLTLMLQAEVADRLVAVPGIKNYGRLSVLAQCCGNPKIEMKVSARAFTPTPKVDSSLVRLEPRSRQMSWVEFSLFMFVAQKAFGQRRKMLRSSLKGIVPDTIGMLVSAGIDPTSRAEELSVEDFRSLAVALRHLAVSDLVAADLQTLLLETSV